jgi:hypothetical protein
MEIITLPQRVSRFKKLSVQKWKVRGHAGGPGLDPQQCPSIPPKKRKRNRKEGQKRKARQTDTDLSQGCICFVPRANLKLLDSAILLPQPPKYQELQKCPTSPGLSRV